MLGAGKAVQWVGCLSCKLEDLSADPQDPHRSQVLAPICIPSTREGSKGELQGLPGQPAKQSVSVSFTKNLSDDKMENS